MRTGKQELFIWTAFVVLLFFRSPLGAQSRSGDRSSEGREVHVQMRNVMYHFRDDVAVHIRRLGGELVPAEGRPMPVFDDKESFTLRITAAEVAVRADSLARILNDNVFARNDSPIKDVSITVAKDRLKIRGNHIAKETLVLRPRAG